MAGQETEILELLGHIEAGLDELERDPRATIASADHTMATLAGMDAQLRGMEERLRRRADHLEDRA